MIDLRRVTGESMRPGFRPNQVVLAVAFRRPKVGTVVIVEHEGIEKIKRLIQVRPNEIYIVGDNPAASTDSRHFGWLPQTALKARIVWPRTKMPILSN